ncbi:MAG: hypothetical protein HZA91_12650 [Verrucomicrobia bacterium]|nr:hypothetical protein [Verrucomicrobiota bacterium]
MKQTIAILALMVLPAFGVEMDSLCVRKADWQETMLASRAALKVAALPPKEAKEAAARVWRQVERDFRLQWDWALQDGGLDFPKWFASDANADIERAMIARVLDELGGQGAACRKEFDALCAANVSPNDRRWLDLYVAVCEQRRVARLQPVLAKAPRIIFTKHETIRPSFFAYTEGLSDAQAERHFHPGSSLCLLERDGARGKVRTLLHDPTGAIRDPAVSYDGARVLFAWKKSLNDDDYHLYEMEVASGSIRQITSGLGHADFEPAYLPSGDIVFSSTRCVQQVDCFSTEVSNLYTCDKDGRFLRRLGFDQVHTVYPAVTDDGRVTYTRWDYNDRGQIFPQALFQMNYDGTGQTEFYGNNSWFPTTITHARGIPGSQKVVAIFCGHHSPQTGKLAIIDPAKGRQENHGAQLIAPVRETPAERIDGYGQNGELFQYPYPLSETEFLVTYSPMGWNSGDRRKRTANFGIYFMTMDGRRELLASDPELPCNQPFPFVARPRPALRPSVVDYRKTTGTYYVQDVHAGLGLAGIPRGTIKKLRVVGLEFRAAVIGGNGSRGPGGAAFASTPVSIGNGTWDVKVLLGDAKVHDDGSTFFTAPARTPLYFQALDEKGRAVQTMRSWSTLQPGENQSCVGCHEHKNSAPLAGGYAMTGALRSGPQALEPFYGPPRGFSFAREIQPILDRHCVSCHNDRAPVLAMAQGDGPKTLNETLGVVARGVTRPEQNVGGALAPRPSVSSTPGVGALRPLPHSKTTAFSLLGETVVDTHAKRRWSDAYLMLTQSKPLERKDRSPFFGDFTGRLVNWIGAQSVPEPLPPCYAGSTKSALLPLLESGHGSVKLSHEELEKIACWIDLLVPYCADYTEAHAWDEREQELYAHFLEKRRRMETVERDNIASFLRERGGH